MSTVIPPTTPTISSAPSIKPSLSNFRYQPVLITGLQSNAQLQLSPANPPSSGLKSQRSQPCGVVSPRRVVTPREMVTTQSGGYRMINQPSQAEVKVIVPSAYIAQRK